MENDVSNQYFNFKNLKTELTEKQEKFDFTSIGKRVLDIESVAISKLLSNWSLSLVIAADSIVRTFFPMLLKSNFSCFSFNSGL